MFNQSTKMLFAESYLLVFFHKTETELAIEIKFIYGNVQDCYKIV